MGYVISGTTVNSVDYTDFPFGGVAGAGSALSSAPAGWISYTFTRPDVRTAPDGKDYFIVKNVSFRTCAAPFDSEGKSGASAKMYGRVSWADGSEYTNSYQPPNAISWQKAPTVTYTFQGTSFAVKEGDNGTTMRVWLVSGGAFLFQRNPGGTGHVVGQNGQTYAGSPAGYMTVAQIASPPLELAAVRMSPATQTVTLTWKKPASAGGTMSGYHLQVAEDAAFTKGVREYYPAIKSGAALTYLSTGYSEKKQYWFRIAARNEVSEFFKIPGGQWSNVASIDVAPGTAAAPPADGGVVGGSAGGGTNGSGGSTSTSPGGADGSGGSKGGAGGTITTGGGTAGTVGGTPVDGGDTSGDAPTTGTSGSTGGSSSGSQGSTTPGASDFQKVLGRLGEVAEDLSQLAVDMASAMRSPSSTAFKLARSDTNALKSDASYIATRSTGTTWLPLWSTVLVKITAAYALLTNAANAAADTNPTGDAAVYQQASNAIDELITLTKSAMTAVPATDPSLPDDGSGGAGSSGGSEGGTVVYTPIPDTSADRSAKGGLLRSRQPTGGTATRVFVYDRGGKRRIGELHDLSTITWSRVRDDISAATITMTPSAAEKNIAILRRMGVARSELVIYRGSQRVWEGPIDRATPRRSGFLIHAQDVLWYAKKTAIRHAYSNAYPNIGYTVDRIAGIFTVELARLETPKYAATGEILVPPINVLPFLHTYVEDGDVRTSQATDAYPGSLWQHLDDLAAQGGIDYTVVGRAVHIWDTSRAAMGRTRTVTEQDFIGDPYISYYGSEVATVYSITDGQGDWASLFNQVEIDDPYYGELEEVSQAYGASSTTTTTNPDGTNTTTTTAQTVSLTELADQATRGALGRDPVPAALHIPDGSSIDVSRSGLGIDTMIPGVYVPVLANFSGFRFATTQKIASMQVDVTATKDGITETVAVNMEPASDDDNASSTEDDS